MVITRHLSFFSRTPRTVSKDGSVHVTDEIVNTLISLLGLLLSIPAVLSIVNIAWLADKPWHVAGLAVYGLGLVGLFLSSVIHHGLDGPAPLEHRLRQLDYAAIFVMIASTFAPFCFVLFRNVWGIALFLLVWVLAIYGIFLTGRFPDLPKRRLVPLYLLIGWLGAPLFPSIAQHLGWAAVYPLILGGFFLCLGLVVYCREKPNPLPGRFGFHEIWHLMVLLGIASHFVSIFFYLLPYSDN